MAFDWNATSGFYVFAALVQFALAIFLIVRRVRSEWSWVLALLFAFNASTAVAWALGAGLPRTRWAEIGAGVRTWFDPTTSFLILYLALIYPSRPAVFERRPWLLRALVFVPCIVLLYAFTLDRDGFISRNGRSLLGWVFVDAAPIAGWTAVLWRWSLLLPKERSPVRRRQFQFIFAAFGIRAAHMTTFVPLDRWSADVAFQDLGPYGVLSLLTADQWYNFLWLVLLVANGVVLVWALVHLARARNNVPTESRSAIEFVILLLLIGIMEGLFGLSVRLLDWQFALWIYFDVLAVRPALLWMGVLRYELQATRFGTPGFALGLFSLLAVGVLFPGIRPLWVDVFPGSTPLPDILAVLIAMVIAGALATALRPYFLRQPFPTAMPSPTEGGDVSRRDAVERYVASLEDAMQEGRLTARAETQLERLRGGLGISDEQHDALLWAVRSRWSEVPQTRDWIPAQTVGGRYRIEGIIGEGGTGTVYRAEDVVAGSPVVLKRTHRMDTEARRLLLREAYAAGKLQHPAIVRFIATEEVRGEPVLVYEYLPAGTLKTRLADEGRLPIKTALKVATQVLSALEATHRAGIVHRDVKPSNILFTEDGEARLGDFGTAHVHTPPSAFGDPTRTGTQPGTLRYMSPEQARGLPTGPESDIYSVALVLYESITGQPLVPETLDDWEVRKAIIEGDMPDLSVLPAPLVPVLEQALAKDPQRRIASARAFADALRQAARRIHLR